MMVLYRPGDKPLFASIVGSLLTLGLNESLQKSKKALPDIIEVTLHLQ